MKIVVTKLGAHGVLSVHEPHCHVVCRPHTKRFENTGVDSQRRSKKVIKREATIGPVWPSETRADETY